MSDAALFEDLARRCGPPAEVALDRGAALFRQGDPSPGLPLVRAGRVELLRWTASGAEARMHAAGPGEMFAEGAIFAGACHCDARAATPSRVALLPAASARAALAGDPALAERFMAHLAGALMRARRLVELRATAPLSAAVLSRIAELAGPDGRLPEGVRLAALAADAGATPAAGYRALAALERAGAVVREGRGRVRLAQPGQTTRKP